ncbi:hypothetical protein MMC22_011423 [Lobaria immixta]|nr:hypothetical protein [Lobaria immixta]
MPSKKKKVKSSSKASKSRQRSQPRGVGSRITSQAFTSQASTSVPKFGKQQVKTSQQERCWLCNQENHETNRPLQIAHVLGQAQTKRPLFVEHHKSGGIQISNIHDVANLMALCSICHDAFDTDEWTFLPEEMSIWLRDAEADPKEDYIKRWNSRRDLKFHRWRLRSNPESKAFRDHQYQSAFTKYPVKEWKGEVGAVILANNRLGTLSTRNIDKDLAKAVEEWGQLRTMWVSCEIPCSKEECTICSPEPKPAEDKLDEGKGNGKEGEESDGGDNDGRYWGQLRGRGGQAPSRAFPKRHGYRTRPRKLGYGRHLFRAMRLDRTKVSMPRRITRRRSRSKRPEKSALYDESVPYSHREGYTWADHTSNELMARWQGLPYIRHNDGRITVTGKEGPYWLYP